jgi:formylglycine-generating enzyme required for sulfatase activity
VAHGRRLSLFGPRPETPVTLVGPFDATAVLRPARRSTQSVEKPVETRWEKAINSSHVRNLMLFALRDSSMTRARDLRDREAASAAV